TRVCRPSPSCQSCTAKFGRTGLGSSHSSGSRRPTPRRARTVAPPPHRRPVVPAAALPAPLLVVYLAAPLRLQVAQEPLGLYGRRPPRQLVRENVDPPGTAVGDAGFLEDKVLEVLRPSQHLVEGRAIWLEMIDQLLGDIGRERTHHAARVV